MRLLTCLSTALSSLQPVLHRLPLLGLLTVGVFLGGASASRALPDGTLAQPSPLQSYCEQLLVNPGFETQAGWELVGAESPPQFTTDRAYLGEWSMRLGIVGATNMASISAVQQTVQIPTFASSLILSMRHWPISGSGAGNDLQYVDVYNAYNNQFIKRLWSDRQNMTVLDINGDGKTDEVDAAAQEWPFLSWELNDVKSRTDRIRIFFAVTNDGGGGTTALYLDDVQLRACDDQPPTTATGTPSPSPSPSATATPSTTATPSPSPTTSLTATTTATPSITPTPFPAQTATITPTSPPTATPVPPAEGCVELVRNGSFESDSDWIMGQDPYPPAYVAQEYFSGARSMRLGVPADANTSNMSTYSSVRQLITLPSDATGAVLRYRMKSRTDQVTDENPSNASDRQDLILLNPDLSTLAVVNRHLYNTNSWDPLREASLLSYAGRTFFLYFNVYNDGNGARTWAYLDDVSLCITRGSTATALPAATATALPTATATATAAPEIVAAAATPPSDLLAQAYALATQVASVPTLDPDRQREGQEQIGADRPVTPMGQAPIDMAPVLEAEPGLSFGNIAGILLLIVVAVLIVVFIVIRRMGNNESPRP